MTLVSVIIPAFNEDDRLAQAVRSVLAQTHREIEVLVVDDASRIPAGEVLRHLDAPRVRVIRHDRNRGAAAARNTGIAAAKGDVVAFLDADDTWAPGKLEAQLAALADAGESALVSCCSYFLIRNGRTWSARTLQPAADWLGRLAWGCDLSPGSTLVARREAFERVGPFDETLRRFEDWDWLLRYSETCQIQIVTRPLAYINLDAPPPEDVTRDAVGRMLAKHAGRLPRRSRRRFRSAIMLERAAIEYRAHRRLAAVGLVLRAMTVAPFRNARFYLRMVRNLFAVGGRRWARPGGEAKSATGHAATDRVLHVITSLDVGGAERALVNLVAALPPGRRPAGVVCLRRRGPLAEAIEALGVPVTSLNLRPRLPSPAALVKLIRIIRRVKPDIVQSWMYHADLMALLALRLSGRRRQTPLFWGIRCSDMDFADYRGGFRRLVGICARLSRSPTGVIANSLAGRDVHILRGYRPRALRVVHNGVDAARFAPDASARAEVRAELGLAPDAVVIVLVGRVDPMKDHAGFLEAMASVTGATALLAGLDTTDLPAADNVLALGRRDDVPRLLAAADIVVSSSAYGEGFSNALAEGMSAGLAPVATDVGDSAFMVGDCGIVVPPRNPAALGAALQSLVDDPARRADLGRRARRRIESRFSLPAYVRSFREAYEEMIAEAQTGG